MVSFVIMLLIWVGSQALTIYLSFLIVLPLIYTNTLADFLNVDPEMLEMAETFRLSRWKKFLYIYRPSFMPFLISSCRVALVCEGKVDEKQLAEELSQILPPNSLHQPISQLSGGMKRRVALARADALPLPHDRARRAIYRARPEHAARASARPWPSARSAAGWRSGPSRRRACCFFLRSALKQPERCRARKGLFKP